MSVALKVGAASFVGSLVATSVLRRFLKPTPYSTGSGAISVLPLMYSAYELHREDALWTSDLTRIDSRAKGAISGVFLYYMFDAFYAKTRFENNTFSKVLQAPVSSVATLVGDESRAASALLPPKAPSDIDMSDFVECLKAIFKTNTKLAVDYIFKYMIDDGFTLDVNAQNTLVYSRRPRKVTYNDAAHITSLNDSDSVLKMTTANQSTTGLKGVDKLAEKVNLSEALVYDELREIFTTKRNLNTLYGLLSRKDGTISPEGVISTDYSSYEDAQTELNNYIYMSKLGAFLAEPGFKGEFYSGEDHAALSYPAPSLTNAPAPEQLERALQLSPEQKKFEGLSDFLNDPVVIVDPKVARKIESSGRGQSFGRSRSNPDMEVILMTAIPERAITLPQGSLTSPRITQASNVDVRTGGLFTRGTFTPMYGDRKGYV